jgi:small-conductance mechanosensitive channel
MVTTAAVQTGGAGRCRWLSTAAAVALLLWALAAAAEPAAPDASVETAGQAGLVLFFNRPIFVLRASLHGRPPAERARTANECLRSLTSHKPIGEISVVPSADGRVVRIGEDIAFAITPGDLDAVGGQTLEQATAVVVQRLTNACTAKDEQRSLPYLLRATAMSLVAVLAMLFVMWGLRRLERVLLPLLLRAKMSFTQRFSGTSIGAVSQASERTNLPARLVFWFLHALVAYTCFIFCLGRFPYTSIWAESMGSRIVGVISGLVSAVVAWLPDLLAIVIIFVLARLLVAVIHSVFEDVEQGRLKVAWCDPLTAKPTSRILSVILWLFALVMAYPYLPGSDSAAFKGVSVFVGLLVSLGGSGVIGQVVGGFVLMYTRALKPGDYVRVGEDEGVVEEIGFLSTTIRTPKREQINVPNAMLLSMTSKNYSSLAGNEGVIVRTAVTIGYDTPWRQVHAMLLEAAKRTPAVCGPPAPYVLQTGLDDFYIEYQLNVYLRTPSERLWALSALHTNILDVFNEYGVQITSPHYVADPPQKAWVPKDRWYAPPAAVPGHEAAEQGATAATGARGTPASAKNRETRP